MIGQQFGKLTIKDVLINYKGDHRTFLECQCDCGNTIIKRSDRVKNGVVTSCGCDKPEYIPRENRRKDYTGQKFGHLTVVEMLFNYGKAGEAFCRCVCECGKECVKSSYDIRHSRNPAHCGCKTEYYQQIQSENGRKDLTGMRFGRLVVKEMEYNYKGKTYCICDCDCGNEIRVVNTYLTSGDTTSCGCYKRERIKEANSKDFTGIISDYGVEFICRDRLIERSAGGLWLWKCKCGFCGNEFVTIPAEVLNGDVTSCGCNRQSSGEKLISLVLDELNVKYDPEHSFAGCTYRGKLRFDFYIDDYKIAIEYQGRQHYEPSEFFGGIEEFEDLKIRDNIKKKYCKDNNITLVEIPYYMTNNETREKLQTLFIRRDCDGRYGDISA